MIIVTLVLMIILGIFPSILITNGMKSGLKKNITTIAVALIIGFLLTIACKLEWSRDEELWNNGYCNCGNEWKIVNVERIRNGKTYYYYNCDKCGQLIELHSNFQE